MTDRNAARRRCAPVLMLVLLALAWSPGAAIAQTDQEPDLDQQIDADQEIVTGERAVLERGHVDMGPRFVDGEWTLLIHDDAAKADPDVPSVWRYPEDTVFRVGDEAMLQVPESETYAFLGVEPGSDVYVVPQTQHPDVVWVGWNTQDPEVMEDIDRGVTMSLVGVQGPGSLVVYLQSGSFEEPDVLWDSKLPDVQPAWVEVNTHAHANWVFTDPGVYLVRVEISADLVDGRSVSDTRDLRFAVGDEIDVDAAFSAEWEAPPVADEPAPPDGEAVAGTEPPGAPAAEGVAEESAAGGGPGIGVILAVIAVVLVAALVVGVVRGRDAKRRALAGREPRP